MFARLVYNQSVPSSAQTIFATIVNILTGTITANTQLDPYVYNRSASYIVNGAGAGANTGWTVIDSQANLVANAAISSNPVVIGSPWSDSSFYGKYLYLAPANTSNNIPNFVSIPMDGWQANTKSTSNGLFLGQFTGGASAFTYLANATALGAQAVFNSSNNVSRWYDFINLGAGSLYAHGITSNFHTTILSSSNTHLLIANFINGVPIISAGTKPSPQLTNYFFLSEYSRDDAYNTAASGFPSWFAEGASIPLFSSASATYLGAAATNTFVTSLGLTFGNATNYQHTGIVAAQINTNSNNSTLGVPMFTPGAGISPGGLYSNWGITTRFFNWPAFQYYTSYNLSSGVLPNYINVETPSSLTNTPYSRGLATAANFNTFLGNQNITRDINKNPAVPIAELRLTNWAQGSAVYGANTIWSGGSISGVTPYLYATSAQFNNFDEISLGGNTYMVINFNNAHLVSTASNYKSNILILER